MDKNRLKESIWDNVVALLFGFIIVAIFLILIFFFPELKTLWYSLVIIGAVIVAYQVFLKKRINRVRKSN